MTATATPARPKVTVWYDDQCPLCVREIALFRRLDRGRGAIAFVPVAGEGTCPLDRELLLARFHAREGDGPLVSGANAFAAMWRAIPILAPAGRLATWPPLSWLLERLYRLFLRMRPWLQRLAGRIAPLPETPR